MAEKDDETPPAETPAATKTCFIISEYGEDDGRQRERLQMNNHLVRKVLEPLGYSGVPFDQIDELGQITNQIIEHLLDDDLVIADLTGLNPNVFYELAVRHAARKPVITIIRDGTPLPFDIKDVRTVFYDLHDPDKLDDARDDLRKKVKALEKADPERLSNPITAARDIALLKKSTDPDKQTAGVVLAAIDDLGRELRRGADRPPARGGRLSPRFVRVQAAALAEAVEADPELRQVIRELHQYGGAAGVDFFVERSALPDAAVQPALQALAQLDIVEPLRGGQFVAFNVEHLTAIFGAKWEQATLRL